MLPVINNSEAFSRFLDLYREHNARGGTETHQRKCRASDGTYYYKDVTRKVNQIPESVKTTFYMILREYVASYNRTASQMPVGMYTAQDPPSLLTNRIRLSEACDCSDKTVYNHIETLGSLGVIRRKFHGRKKDFELWISTDLLFGNSGKEGTKNAQKTVKTASSEEDRKNLPLNNIHRESLEKENRSADRGFCGYGENDHGERGRAGNPARPAASPPTSPAGPPDGEMSTGGGGAAMAPQKPQVKVPKAYLELLMEFWLYAWKVIYPARDFSQQEQEKAIVAIMAGVYDGFSQQRPPREWAEFQTRQLEKLDKAAKWYDLHPDAYRPDPFAIQVKGKGYFDRENLRGFRGLEAWMKKDEERRHLNRHAYDEARQEKQKRAETLLRRARRDFEKLRLGAKPRKEVAAMDTQLALFQYYRVVFDGFGKTWSDKFYKQYLDQQSVDFKPPKYYRSRKSRRLAGEISEETVVYVESWMQHGDWYYSEA